MTPSELDPLDERTVDPDPITQFSRWYDAAIGATDGRASAMTVATVGADGRPSSRVVLLRGFDASGFVFFTNYESRKGVELADGAPVAAQFYWPQLDAQIRIEGFAARIGEAESDTYFAHRPRGHQIGAWASRQSEVIADRATLEAQVEEIQARFPEMVPRPPHWGGYRVQPDRMEFWRNRDDRVHDRVEYLLTPDGWTIQRLSP